MEGGESDVGLYGMLVVPSEGRSGSGGLLILVKVPTVGNLMA